MTSYNAEVGRHFWAPANLGPLAPGAGPISRGHAAASLPEAEVRIEVAIVDGRIERLAFQARGCPHLLAACSRATELLAGQDAPSLATFEPAVLVAELGIPDEKRGSLLILQDALRNCFRDWDTTQPAAAR